MEWRLIMSQTAVECNVENCIMISFSRIMNTNMIERMEINKRIIWNSSLRLIIMIQREMLVRFFFFFPRMQLIPLLLCKKQEAAACFHYEPANRDFQLWGKRSRKCGWLHGLLLQKRLNQENRKTTVQQRLVLPDTLLSFFLIKNLLRNVSLQHTLCLCGTVRLL